MTGKFSFHWHCQYISSRTGCVWPIYIIQSMAEHNIIKPKTITDRFVSLICKGKRWQIHKSSPCISMSFNKMYLSIPSKWPFEKLSIDTKINHVTQFLSYSYVNVSRFLRVLLNLYSFLSIQYQNYEFYI